MSSSPREEVGSSWTVPSAAPVLECSCQPLHAGHQLLSVMIPLCHRHRQIYHQRMTLVLIRYCWR